MSKLISKQSNPTTISTKKGEVMIVEAKNTSKVRLGQHGDDVAICYGEGLDVRCEIVAENTYANGYKLLGCIDNGVVDFDCSELVEEENIVWGSTAYPDGTVDKSVDGKKIKTFKNYDDKNTIKLGLLPTHSFLSLLQSKSIDITKGKYCVLLIVKN